MNRLMLAFLSATALVEAAEPAPKLVPRPIPGMHTAAPVASPSGALMGSSASPAAGHRPSTPPVDGANATAPAANEPARILYVHRRDRLPAAMRQRLKALPVEPPSPSAPSTAVRETVQERPAAIRIIPKSEVPLLKPPPVPSNSPLKP